MSILQLIEHDRLPQNVCETCVGKLIAIQEFRVICETVDVKLKEYFSSKDRDLHVFIYQDEHDKNAGNVAEKILVKIKGEPEEMCENFTRCKQEYEDVISDTVVSGHAFDDNERFQISTEVLGELSNVELISLQEKSHGEVTSEIKVEDSSENRVSGKEF